MSGGLPRWHPWSCKIVQTCCSIGSSEARPDGHRSATVVKNIMFKVQGRAAKSRRHLTPSSLPIRQVYGLLPVLIDSIRLLPLALWLIIFFHVWVIVNLLYAIARVYSKSFYLRFVEMYRWNYWTASPCYLPLNTVDACFGDRGSSVPHFKRLVFSDRDWILIWGL
jgi:CBS domain containing-hemolysin-like protein